MEILERFGKIIDIYTCKKCWIPKYTTVHLDFKQDGKDPEDRAVQEEDQVNLENQEAEDYQALEDLVDHLENEVQMGHPEGQVQMDHRKISELQEFL